MTEAGTDEAGLIAAAAGGDRSAFAALVTRHYDFIYRVAYRCVGRKADAEDIAQEVCIRLGKAIRGFRGAGAFTTWLYALTLNAARDLGRRHGRESVKTKAFAVHAMIDGEAERTEDDPAERLWAAVRLLPDKQREAVLLVHGEGLSHQAASDVMGVAEATVSWHLHEARKRLKQMLRTAGEG